MESKTSISKIALLFLAVISSALFNISYAMADSAQSAYDFSNAEYIHGVDGYKNEYIYSLGYIEKSKKKADENYVDCISKYRLCEHQLVGTDTFDFSAEWFSLTIPSSWKGRYFAKVTENGVDFYDAYSNAGGYGGYLFSVFKAKLSEMNDLRKNNSNYQGDLCKTDAYYAYKMLPTDVPYGIFSDEDIAEYQSLSKDIDSILKTVKCK